MGVLVEVDVTVGVSVGAGVCVAVGEGAQATAVRANNTKQAIFAMRLKVMIYLLRSLSDNPRNSLPRTWLQVLLLLPPLDEQTAFTSFNHSS